jgi:hypothetical protein
MDTVKFRAVDRSTIQFFSIFGVLLTEMFITERYYLHTRRVTIQFSNFFGVLLTEACTFFLL